VTGAGEKPGTGETGPQRRLHARSIAWIVALLLAVAAALTVSFLVAPEDATDVAPVDEVALCDAATDLRGLDVSLDLSGSLDEIDALVAALDAVEAAAPQLADDLAVVRSTFREVQLLATEAPPGDLAASTDVMALLDSRGPAMEAAAVRLGAYLDRWCGPPTGA